MRDERLEVDAALRDEVDGELVVPRLVTRMRIERRSEGASKNAERDRDLRRSGKSP